MSKKDSKKTVSKCGKRNEDKKKSFGYKKPEDKKEIKKGGDLNE